MLLCAKAITWTKAVAAAVAEDASQIERDLAAKWL